VSEALGVSARLGQPFDCLGYPISTGLRLLPLLNPSRVLRAVAEGELLVRGLGCWILSKRCGELSWLDHHAFLMVLDEFNLDHVADPDLEPPEQLLAEAEIACPP
jgi:hypothetical protein